MKGESVMKNAVKWTITLVIILVCGVALFGCTTAPVPNINIGGLSPDSDGTCAPQNVNITVINQTDKATIGDGSDINDDDATGAGNPSAGSLL